MMEFLSKIMHFSSLSHKSAKKYLTILIDQKLIDYNKKNYNYRTNIRGLKFVDSTEFNINDFYSTSLNTYF